MKKEKRTSSVTLGRGEEGIGLRWNDGNEKEDVVRNIWKRSRRGYRVEVQGWKRKSERGLGHWA